ncbi:MAG TPA: type II secretion system protein [Candidatus Omnitrophica bacterium]|nr:type II secretion system protein [Candidatus Omnitrophota bacterium]
MKMCRFNKKGFTLIELLIVATILAILAMIVIPNFAGFDVGARVAATQSNLNVVRTAIAVFRSKEGAYPVSLGDLATITYLDAGVTRTYLKKIPPELISDKKGNVTYVDQTSVESLSNTGGWVYFKDRAEIAINISTPLDEKWSEYKGQIPFEW